MLVIFLISLGTKIRYGEKCTHPKLMTQDMTITVVAKAPLQKRREAQLTSDVVCVDCTPVTGLKVDIEGCVNQPCGFYCADALACKARMLTPLPKRARKSVT